MASESERRLPAPVGAVELGDPLDRGRAQQREPEPPVGAEALLRGEVVGVGLRRVERAARRRRRWRRSGPARRRRPSGAANRDRDPGRGLVVGPGDRVGGRVRRPARARRPARPRSRSGRPGTGRRRSPSRTWLENSPKLRCSGRSRTSQAVGRVPERCGAAVAERDLVAVGGVEQLGDPAADPGDQVLDRSLPMRRADHRRRSRRASRAPRGAPSTGRSRSGRRRA